MGNIGRRAVDQVAKLALSAAILLALSPADAAAQLRARLHVSGFNAPVAFVQDPSDRAVQYVVQQGGLIFALRNRVIQPTPFLDLRGFITAGGEQGLLGLAFPPDYATSGRFYVYFNQPGGPANGNAVVARFLRSSGNPLVADLASRKDLVWSTGQAFMVHPFANHNGGNLAFGPDGFLYIGTGDGGSSNDPGNNAQTPSSLLGKMLRIDVDVPLGDAKGFVIPASNPFQPGNPLGALPEIWSFGLRNPWRWSFDDPARGGTGALVIADVGQGRFEEVDYEPAGAGGRNYGWSIREGAHPHQNRPAALQPLIDPIHEYGHAFGVSITGGYVYRGARLGAGYRGRYFFADFGSGRVWSLGLTVNPSTHEATVANIADHTNDLGGVGNVSAFGVDADGELYIVDYSGRILAIERNERPAIGDIDGDFRSDMVVWRPGDGGFYTLTSGTGFSSALRPALGVAGDTPLLGDIDGDLLRDVIVWHPADGTWSWRTSSSNYASGGSQQWGDASLGDVPFLGDMDDDARADLIVWRPSTGTFSWLLSSAGFDPALARSRQWGNSSLGDVPFVADFDGDRRSDLAVWRASTGTWFWIFNAGNFDYAAARSVQWGNASLGDQPLLGDFDGDRRADVTVWRASTGTWFWLTSSNGYASGISVAWGRASLGDQPLLGDIDGDACSDVAVWRASNGTWFWLTSRSGYTAAVSRVWGNASLGDIPIVK